MKKLFLSTMQRFHPLTTDIEPPRRFTNPFFYEPHPLCLLAAEEVQRYVSAVGEWQDEIGQGKMFGVLVVQYRERIGYLAAFSGQLCGRNDWPFFVPAVYDLLLPNGHFKTEEGEITAINRKIETIENSHDYTAQKAELKAIEEEAATAIANYRNYIKQRKQNLHGEELVKESQFLNAELHRMKKRYATLTDEAKGKVQAIDNEIDTLKQLRKTMSDDLQHWLFAQFRMLNARGERRDLCDIFAETVGKVPPSGAGECCAPKLLQYAYEHGMCPLCMAEFWWGASPKTEVRQHLCYYPACRGKCKPILEHMLQGLEIDPYPLDNDKEQEVKIVYDDDCICVISKPAGMLSVPGKSNRRSVLSEMRKRFPDADGPMIVHRLDMDTSGLMVVAKTMDTYLSLQRQFCEHTIRKRYIALLSLLPNRPTEGTISLPLRPDPLDRPRQVVDKEQGKQAVTDYRIKEIDGKVVAELYPRTGRTHQLRIHCAHAEGLGSPIIGDNLYGKSADRLYLHAEHIEFVHPATNEPMSFDEKDCAFPLSSL